MEQMKIIARIHTDFKSKFGIPRQSRVVEELEGEIVFEPEFRNADAVRGLDEWSHIWLIWQFSENLRSDWSPTVRPPRLGGNTHLGVFATRSPFRPNAIGLSAVKLESIELDEERGPVLHVTGADLMDDTPIFDIKPYLPYADIIPQATGGFTDKTEFKTLDVVIPVEIENKIPSGKINALRGVLENDPRPHYHNDSERIYGFEFAGVEIHFKVFENTLIVIDVSEEIG